MESNWTKINKSVLCVEYPGIVRNVDRMLDTLGGLREISQVCSGRNRRLELRFRPSDVLCKPACGDRHKTNGILCRARVRRRKAPKEEDQDPKVVSFEVLGRVTMAFRFKSVCDFQYLPMDLNNEGKMVSIVNAILPTKFQGDALKTWLEEPARFFLPPAAFSRIDSVSSNAYQFRKDSKNQETSAGPLIGRTRKRRAGHAVFVSFNVDKIPQKPRDKAVKFLEMKFLSGEPYEKIKKIFEERPIWSKLALMCVLNMQSEQLKYLLPAVSYYFITGPFRVMWVKFGYDPRIDPSSRIYQTLDYRIRAPAGLLSLVKAKRGYANYLLFSKPNQPGSKGVVISKELISNKGETSQPQEPVDEPYIFYPNKIPPARQMFYQYCDVRAPEIEVMIARLPKVPLTPKCDPRNGWLPPGFDNQCRDIINEYVMRLLKRDINMETLKDEDPEQDDSDTEEQQWEEVFGEEMEAEDSDQNDDAQ